MLQQGLCVSQKNHYEITILPMIIRIALLFYPYVCWTISVFSHVVWEFLQPLLILVQPIGSSHFLLAS